MNIGIDARVLGYKKAGVRTYLEEVLEYIDKNDDENKYFLYTNRDIDFSFSNENKFIIRKYTSKIGTLGLRHKVPGMLKKDGINVFWGPAHVLPRRVNGVKYVLTIHDLATFKMKRVLSFYNGLINKFFAKKSAKIADNIIAISNSTKNDIVDIFKIPSSKISVVYNAEALYNYHHIDKRVDNDSFAMIKEKYSINTNYFLFVGSIEPRKNLVRLVKAYNNFRDAKVGNLLLVIAGGNGWRNKKIFKEINNSPYHEDIILTGYVSSQEKEMLYRNATLLTFPSLYEGFGYPIIESLSVGTPVLTSTISAMPEAGGKVCYYANPLDVSDISKQMLNAFDDVSNNKIDELELVKQSKLFNKNEFCINTLRVIIGGMNEN